MRDAIERLGINKALISAAGVDWERGVSCFHFHEVAPKQAAIATAMQRLLVVDASKFGVVRPAYFASLADFDVVITDDERALACWKTIPPAPSASALPNTFGRTWGAAKRLFLIDGDQWKIL